MLHEIDIRPFVFGSWMAECSCGWKHFARTKLECELRASVHDLDDEPAEREPQPETVE